MALRSGKLDMGALIKTAMASPAIAPHKKDASSMPRSWPRHPHSLSPEALGLGEFQTLPSARAGMGARARGRAGGCVEDSDLYRVS
jgi:hypothetical protein